MKINYLKAFCLFVTLNASFQSIIFAQAFSLVNRINPHKLDSNQAWVVKIDPDKIMNSKNGLRVDLKFEKDSDLFVWIRKDGGILIFEDSSFSVPKIIEKRNFYPFPDWQKEKTAFLFISKKIIDHGYLRICIKNDKILDDLFVCMASSWQKVKSI